LNDSPQRIRILLAIGSMQHGGSEMQMLRLLQNLDRTRYAPELFLISPGGELFEEIPEDVPVHLCDQSLPRRGLIPGSAHRARVKSLAKLLDDRNIDLVVDRTYHMSLLTAGAVRKRPTARMSIVVSDPHSDFATNRERFRRTKKKMLRRAYTESDVVGCVSNCVKERAGEFYQIPTGNFAVLGNLYDVDEIRARAEELLPAEFAGSSEQKRIVAIGRLHAAKAYDILIESMRLLRDESNRDNVELLIAGRGPEQAVLQHQIQAAGLEDTVKLIGYQPNPLPLVKTADLFCICSRYEGLPNSLIEAVILGIPVVATDCFCGPREILEDGKRGALVPPDDPTALAAAIDGALDNLEAFRQRAEAAVPAMAKTYSLSAGLARFDELAELTIERFRK
jgi:glycosyltransferase involved in cell wall biosynthesis